MLTRNYRCVHRYTCLSAALLVRLFEFGTRYTEGKPHVDAIKDGGRRRGSFLKTFLRWTFFEMKSLNLRGFFFFFQAFFQINTCRVQLSLLIGYLSRTLRTKSLYEDDEYSLHYENSHAWSTWWHNIKRWYAFRACTLPDWIINRIREILKVDV